MKKSRKKRGPMSQETKDKISLSNIGKKKRSRTELEKEIKSENMKKTWEDLSFRQLQSKRKDTYWKTEESHKKHSDAMKEYWRKRKGLDN